MEKRTPIPSTGTFFELLWPEATQTKLEFENAYLVL
jgi:hypothetical protein